MEPNGYNQVFFYRTLVFFFIYDISAIGTVLFYSFFSTETKRSKEKNHIFYDFMVTFGLHPLTGPKLQNLEEDLNNCLRLT